MLSDQLSDYACESAAGKIRSVAPAPSKISALLPAVADKDATALSPGHGHPRYRRGIPAQPAGTSRGQVRLQVEHSGHNDTHNRHQRAWTPLYSAGLWERSVPGHGRCWTSWPCFASRRSGVRVPIASPGETFPADYQRINRTGRLAHALRALSWARAVACTRPTGNGALHSTQPRAQPVLRSGLQAPEDSRIASSPR